MSKIEAQHTPGQLTVHENGEANSYTLIDTDGQWLISLLHNGQQVTEKQRENFRRLAACWNRLAKFTTGQIEDAGYDLFADVRPDFDRAMRQRDQLLGVLKRLAENPGHTFESDYELALRAIAEVEGGPA